MPDYVLIADDDPLVVEVIVDFLGLMGVQSRVARNGREALEMIRADRPKVLILDLLMPLVNGFSTLTQLAKEHGTPIPVIVLSGLADQVGAVRQLPGVVGTMVKGRFSLAELQALLTTAGALEDPSAMAARRLPAPSPAVRPTGPLPPATPLRIRRTGPLPPRGPGKLSVDHSPMPDLEGKEAPSTPEPETAPKQPAESSAEEQEPTPASPPISTPSSSQEE